MFVCQVRSLNPFRQVCLHISWVQTVYLNASFEDALLSGQLEGVDRQEILAGVVRMLLPLHSELLVLDLSAVSLHDRIEVVHRKVPVLIVSQDVVHFRVAWLETVEPAQDTRHEDDLASRSDQVSVEQLFSQESRPVVISIHHSFDQLLCHLSSRVNTSVVHQHFKRSSPLELGSDSSDTFLFGQIELEQFYIHIDTFCDVTELLDRRSALFEVSSSHYERLWRISWIGQQGFQDSEADSFV